MKVNSLIDKQLKEGLLLSKLPQFKKKEIMALDHIRLMENVSEKNYVSCSWGKQSIIVSHMVAIINPEIDIVFFNGPDSELISDFKKVSNEFINNFIIVNYIELQDSERHLKTSAWKFTFENNYTGFYMGLAKIESKGRKWTLRKGYRNIFQYHNKIFRCCPLADWSIEDCAAYIAKYNLPLLNIYHKYGLYARTSAGVTPGTHAEQGIDLLSSDNKYEIRERWKERNRNGIR